MSPPPAPHRRRPLSPDDEQQAHHPHHLQHLQHLGHLDQAQARHPGQAQHRDAPATCNPDLPDALANPSTAGGRARDPSRRSAGSGRERRDADAMDPAGAPGRGAGAGADPAAAAATAAGRPELRRSSPSGTPLLYKRDDAADAASRPSTDDPEAGLASPLDADADADADHPRRPMLGRRSTMRSRSPRAGEQSARQKYTYAAFFLSVSLVSFCVQTELSAYIQHDLGWDKAYCMMYFTHGSWVVLWPAMLLVLRVQKPGVPWPVLWRRHKQMLSSTIAMIELQTLDVFSPDARRRARPAVYLVRTTAFVTTALTVAGLSWYVAIGLTTPSDLTAIYNCSAFFAYAFSVPILREPLRLDKSVAVSIAIVGVLVVAYGDTGASDAGDASAAPGNTEPAAASRFLGNLVIGVGSVLYGLYEVLYKRYACPPEGVSPGRGTIFANTFGACIGFFTLTVLWIPLPIIHFLGIERFELPDASTCWLILWAVLANAVFSGSFLVLISLTSPVLSSVAALLTIFIVALADWFLTGQPLSWAAIIGGSMIVVAFLGLSWSTYREMAEHEARKLAVDLSDSDEDGDLTPSDR